MPRFTKGCTYQYTKNGAPMRVKLVGYDPIYKMDIVSQNGNETRLNLKALPNVKAVRTSRKTDTKNVYLYLCDIGGGNYKIGATCSPDKRIKQISTYAPKAVMKAVVRLPSNKGSQWTKHEKKVLDQFKGFRTGGGGREVVSFQSKDVSDCASFMRSVATGA